MERMTHGKLVIAMAVVAFGLGCATDIRVSDISNQKPEEFDSLCSCKKGIPFRVMGPYTVRVFQLGLDGKYAQVGKPLRVKLPDPKKLYTLNYDSDLFSNHTFKLVLRANGTLASAGTTQSQQLDEALAAIGTQAGAAGSAILTRETKELGLEKAELEAKAGVIDAKRALIEAQRKLSETETEKPEEQQGQEQP
jgi:hypothetical protein